MSGLTPSHSAPNQLCSLLPYASQLPVGLASVSGARRRPCPTQMLLLVHLSHRYSLFWSFFMLFSCNGNVKNFAKLFGLDVNKATRLTRQQLNVTPSRPARLLGRSIAALQGLLSDGLRALLEHNSNQKWALNSKYSVVLEPFHSYNFGYYPSSFKECQAQNNKVFAHGPTSQRGTMTKMEVILSGKIVP